MGCTLYIINEGRDHVLLSPCMHSVIIGAKECDRFLAWRKAQCTRGMQEQRLLADVSERERRCTEADLRAKQAVAAAAEETERANGVLKEAADRLEAAKKCEGDTSTSQAALEVVPLHTWTLRDL